MYVFLDSFLLVLHSAWVLFSLTGWAWGRTRLAHLAVMTLTLLSWFGLGAIYGWGYCPFTDWHWQVKQALGETGLPQSYVKYYLDRLTGQDWSPMIVDAGVLLLALGAFGISLWRNWRDRDGRVASEL